MRKPKQAHCPEKWDDAEAFRSSVAHWARKVQVNPKRVALQSMKKKWASSSTKGSVTFNTQLLDKKREFGEYVIVHELPHLKIPNHGQLFKSLLTAYMPDWKERAERTTNFQSRNMK